MMMNQYGLQDGMSMVTHEAILFHDYGMMVIILVVTVVSVIYSMLIVSRGIVLKYTEDKWLEMFWTVVPMIILILLSIPSLKLLYMIDYPWDMTADTEHDYVKVMGHQWYWSYDYILNGKEFVYDSYMVSTEDLKVGDFRLLEVDNPLVCRTKVAIHFMITSGDVIHSFAIPALGVKTDGIPGRLNTQIVLPKLMGSFYGQCSEMCGANHSFMPINLELIMNKN